MVFPVTWSFLLCEKVCKPLKLFSASSSYFFVVVIAENGPRLLVEAEQAKVFSHRGGNVTLPCTFYRDPTAFGSGIHKIRIKWTKLTSDYLREVDVFVSMGYHKKTYGAYQGRVFLKGGSDNDASLVITDLTLEDYGRYKCEVIEGLEDDTAVVALELQGRHSENLLTLKEYLVTTLLFS